MSNRLSTDGSWEFEAVELDNVPWNQIEDSLDRSIYKSKSWLKFVAETAGASPLVIRMRYQQQIVGYFYAVKRIIDDASIVANAVPGDESGYRNISFLDEKVDQTRCYRHAVTWISREYGCIYRSHWIGDITSASD